MSCSGAICCDDFPRPIAAWPSSPTAPARPREIAARSPVTAPRTAPARSCCASRNPTFPIPEYDVISCKPRCGPDDDVVCRKDSDCPNPGQECGTSSFARIDRCFF
jgi:hypothetical protein